MKKYIILLALTITACNSLPDNSHVGMDISSILNKSPAPIIVVSKSERVSNWESNSQYEILLIDGKGEYWALQGKNYDFKKGDTLKK